MVARAVGKALPHDSAHLHVSGTAAYTDDMPEPRGLLHLAVGMSNKAHARLHELDLTDVLDAIGRAARISVDEGHFREDLDVDQFMFDFWAIMMAFHHYARLLRRSDARARADRAFAMLLRNAGGA